MNFNRIHLISLFFIFSLLSFLFINFSYAQFGEVAGQLNFNASIGGSASLPFTLINGGSQPLKFKIILPTLNTIPNSTTPTFSISQMNGTIPAGGQLTLNVTVYMPSNKNKPGMHWSGILQAIELSNNTLSGSGAILQQGVAKIVGVTALKPVGLPILYLLLIILVIIILIVVFYFVIKKVKKPRFKNKIKLLNNKDKNNLNPNKKSRSKIKKRY